MYAGLACVVSVHVYCLSIIVQLALFTLTDRVRVRWYGDVEGVFKVLHTVCTFGSTNIGYENDTAPV